VVSEEDKKKHLYTSCSAWYKTPVGEFALQKLDEKISENFSEIFGYFAFESGALLNTHQFLRSSRVDTCFSLGRDVENIEKTAVKADVEALPLDFDSIDLVLMNHVLECSNDPHQVLREVDRVLVADGHCIIVGFNPLSFWQNRRSFCDSAGSTMVPRLYGVSRMRDWISLLGWKINKISYLSFRARFMKGRLFTKLEKMEKWGSLYWPVFGNIYIIHAQKQVMGGILRKPEWDAAKVLPPKIAINPTPRSTQTRERK